MGTYVKTSQTRRKPSGWAAFDLKKRQEQGLQPEAGKDPYPPMPRTITTQLHPPEKLPGTHNLVSAKSFSSVVENRNLTRVANKKKLKELHSWAANGLIDDVIASVDNDIDKASILLKEMVSDGKIDKYEETTLGSIFDGFLYDEKMDKGGSFEKITELAANIANLSSTLEDALKDKSKELRDVSDSSGQRFNGDSTSDMNLILGHLKSVPVEPEWEEDDVYLSHRKHALRMMRLASQHSRTATTSYLRGDHFSAKQQSFKAKEEWLAAERLNMKAAKEILAVRNDKNDPWKLDLHGLHASEAVRALQEHLQRIETQMYQSSSPNIHMKNVTVQSSSLESSGNVITENLNSQQLSFRQRPLSLQVITGVGNHSRGEAALPSAVRNFLNNNGYCFDEPRPGVVTVRPKFRRG